MTRDQALDFIRARFEEIPAAGVADLLLSPYIAPALLNTSTAESGPSMWIVNRSDVYDASLEALSSHPLVEIAGRAMEKLAQRRSKITLLAPPEIDVPYEQIPDYGVEDVLGHPLVPWDAQLFFARSLNEDHRASSALSLTRRYLEHPPEWLPGDPMLEALRLTFASLLENDPSPFVRAYSARVPIHQEATLRRALGHEKNPFVLGRILQNSALDRESLIEGAERILKEPELQDEFLLRVLALDARLPGPYRSRLQALGDPLATAVHDWYQSLS